MEATRSTSPSTLGRALPWLAAVASILAPFVIWGVAKSGFPEPAPHPGIGPIVHLFVFCVSAGFWWILVPAATAKQVRAWVDPQAFEHRASNPTRWAVASVVVGLALMAVGAIFEFELAVLSIPVFQMTLGAVLWMADTWRQR